MRVKKRISSSIKLKINELLDRKVYSSTNIYELKTSAEPELKNKIAVVTGGTGVIGRAICFRLAALGAKVYVSGRSKSTVEKVVDEINSLGLNAEQFIMDVTDAKSIETSFDNLERFEGRLDILVNCAGGGARSDMAKLDEQSVDVIDSVLNTNLRGTILCTRKATQVMKKQREGRIVIISSTVGVQGKARYSEYAAAKAGMFGFMKSMALELGPFNINVNCVTPGFIQRGEYDEKQLTWLKNTNALHKVGYPEDVANAVAFFSTEQASFITGQSLCVDGGRTLGLYGDK